MNPKLVGGFLLGLIFLGFVGAGIEQIDTDPINSEPAQSFSLEFADMSEDLYAVEYNDNYNCSESNKISSVYEENLGNKTYLDMNGSVEDKFVLCDQNNFSSGNYTAMSLSEDIGTSSNTTVLMTGGSSLSAYNLTVTSVVIPTSPFPFPDKRDDYLPFDFPMDFAELPANRALP